ncbi:MAG: DUF4926 domain-containing protein [Anaerolineae bacterium]
MKIELYQRIVLNRDVPEESLKQGDMAWLIDYVKHPSGGEEGAILEVFNVLGESIDVVTVPVSAIDLPREDQIPSARTIERVK